LAAVLLLMPWFADAAGLGRLAILSSLGQPLNAEIDLVSVQKDELSTLTARLAPPEAYQQANLQYNPALIGLRLSIERRPNGQHYIKITSTRPVNDPFIDLLIELVWSSGRITREYTALIDPPGFAPAPKPAPAPVAPTARPEPVAPAAPVQAAPAPAPRRPAAAPAAPVAPAAAREYGPVQKGETLGKIAASIKPEGVTLEQMLVGLYRSNPDAFINKNLNLVRSGRILRVPEKEELAALPQQEAVKEYRAQVSDWNRYRGQLADAAAPAPEGRAAASGRIGTRVEDRGGEGARDVVRLSKGEPPGAGAKGRSRQALEEDLIARDKALAEANARIAQLEKTIKDQQRLLELKGPGPAVPPQPAAKPEVAKPEAPKPEAPKPAEAPKPVAAAPADSAKPEAKPAEPVPAADKPAAEAKPETPKEAAAEPPKPKPKVVAPPPPPPPPPSLVDEILGEPLYLAAGGGALLLGGLGLWLARRRRARGETDAAPAQIAPRFGKPAEEAAPAAAAAAPVAAAAAAATAAVAATAAPAAPAAVDDVDPLAEAEVYIAYGRDAQAEEILKEALARDPAREDVKLKLLEVYAARKDKAAFNALAGDMNRSTGGAGENWLKVAAMGYALDPENALYAAGRDAPAVASAAETTGTDLDFDLGVGAAGTATDITLDAGGPPQAMQETAVLDPGAMQAMASEADKAAEQPAAPLMPDFTLDMPGSTPAATGTDITLEAAPADSNVIDFNLDLPKAGEPAADQQPTLASRPAQPAADAGLDFKLDIPDISLNLDEQPAAPADKDPHWYDVQQKFDLAKAYQEMGDKDGARDILQEVLKEGDAEQQAQARKLMDSLG
jgi:pilus assembly protein FimV